MKAKYQLFPMLIIQLIIVMTGKSFYPVVSKVVVVVYVTVGVSC